MFVKHVLQLLAFYSESYESSLCDLLHFVCFLYDLKNVYSKFFALF